MNPRGEVYELTQLLTNVLRYMCISTCSTANLQQICSLDFEQISSVQLLTSEMWLLANACVVLSTSPF